MEINAHIPARACTRTRAHTHARTYACTYAYNTSRLLISILSLMFRFSWVFFLENRFLVLMMSTLCCSVRKHVVNFLCKIVIMQMSNMTSVYAVLECLRWFHLAITCFQCHQSAFPERGKIKPALSWRIHIDHYENWGRCTLDLAPPAQTFSAKTLHVSATELNHPHFIRIPIVNRKFHFFFSRITIMLNRFPCGYFHER